MARVRGRGSRPTRSTSRSGAERRVEVAFQFVLPGQPPYGFWVRPGLTLATGAAIQNYSYPVETPFGPGWGQFSWSPEDWSAQEDPRAAGNMLRWARSFAQRLAEGA